jgi:hypothetical protein
MDTDPTRHSKSNDDPRTIDLSPEEVRNVTPGEAEGTDVEVKTSSSDEAASTAADELKAATGEQPEPGRDQPQPPQQPAAAQQRSRGSLLAASFVVGVVVLAGAAGLQYWGVLPNMGSDDKTAGTLNMLSGDVESMKSSIAALKEAKPEVDFTPVNDKIAAIEKKLATVPQPNGLSADADTRISALNDEVAGLKTALAEQKKVEDETKAALLLRLEALEKKTSEPRDDVQVAVAIASAGLKAAIDRGGPFTAELDTLAGIDANDPAVKELKSFAATGVPSRAQLVAQFSDVADRILGAINAGNPNQSLTDRLLASAFSVVKVRPVGNVEGDTPEAVVARMETKLTNGDLKGAAAEWQKLPQAGKQVSADYAKSLGARIRVEELVGSTLTKAMNGTGTKG